MKSHRIFVGYLMLSFILCVLISRLPDCRNSRKLNQKNSWVVVLCSSLFLHLCVKTVYFIAVNLATFKPLLLTRDMKVPCSD